VCPSEQGHDELVQAHGSEDLEIDQNTAIPSWRGENADYARIIEALCAIEDSGPGMSLGPVTDKVSTGPIYT
jgi:hypothetical protein